MNRHFATKNYLIILGSVFILFSSLKAKDQSEFAEEPYSVLISGNLMIDQDITIGEASKPLIQTKKDQSIVLLSATTPLSPTANSVYIGNNNDSDGNLVLACGKNGTISFIGLGEPIIGTLYALCIDENGIIYRTGISSERYKKDITPLEENLAQQILLLQLVRYTIDGSDYYEYGVIAEDLKKMDLLQETIRYNKENKPEMVDYKSIFIAALKLLQTLHATTVKLKEENEMIKNRLATLESTKK